jgi:hypothetical protein
MNNENLTNCPLSFTFYQTNRTLLDNKKIKTLLLPFGVGGIKAEPHQLLPCAVFY